LIGCGVVWSSSDQGLLCVSLVMPKRTLDLCFQSQAMLDLWLWGFKQLCSNAKPSAAAAASAAAGAASAASAAAASSK
jgi:hypothetical protein